MRNLLLLLVALVACDPISVETSERRRPDEARTLHAADAEPLKEEDRAPLPEDTTPDPYEEWRSWCEPVVAACKTTKDCAAIAHPSGKPLKCVRPWYAGPDSEFRVCSPGWSNRAERDHQRARLRELVRLQYSGEDDVCQAHTGWRCGQRRARGRRLAGLLNMVAQRETTMRRWKRHRLNGDIRANRWAFRRTEKIYAGNTHRRERWRWEYGIGLYGMNASLFTRAWDTQAPPEVLCREVESTEAYLRSTRKAWRKLAGGIDCDKDGEREWHGVAGRPTWYDVHHYASGGKLCPSAKSKERFEKRARKAGLEPFAPISLVDLGAPIERADQNETARRLTDALDTFSQDWLSDRTQES